jgi:tol-pal system protein YbgF
MLSLSLSKGMSRGLVALGFILATGVLAPNVGYAQSKQDGQLTVRVQELEDTVRTLNGQVEGLQFQLTQMQQLLQKMQDDNEFRFQQLEGGGAKDGAGKKSSAATQSGGVTPTGALPQPASGDQTADAPAQATDAAPPVDKPPTTAAPDNTAASPAGDDQPMDGDNLGQSGDPLVGTNGADGDSTELGDGRPLNLSLDSSQELASGDAAAQYKAGYDAIVRGDYAFAEDQFRQFIALYPKDLQAPDATNWLGEALLQRQAYDEAADVLLTGFQTYQQSARAPDLLLKLGVALSGAGEQDTACRTFAEVTKRYPKQPAAFNSRLAEERQKAQCPA